MAEGKGKKESEQAPQPQAAGERKGMGLRLVPVGNSDQPVFANVCNVNVAPGVAFIDFGFLEPAMLTALPRVARQGGKLPERIDGRLAVRVAVGVEALASLHQQISRVLAAAQKARKKEG